MLKPGDLLLHPTIRALTHAHRPATTSNDDHQPAAGNHVLAVTMPLTPDAPDLPGAEAEADGLRQLFPGQVTGLTGPQAARWAHFACHGTSDLGNPSASAVGITHPHHRR